MKKLLPYFNIPSVRLGAKNQTGFTLVETLVAISILVLSITAAFTAAQNGISSASYSRDQVVAFYLAAEGVEQIRNMRDNNGIAQPSSGWLTNIALPGDPCEFGKVCTVDAYNNVVASCSGDASTCPYVKLDPVNGFYGYGSDWQDTQFKRSVTLKRINDHEISILVTVTWKKGLLADKRFDIRENIFNWQ